MRLDEAYGLVMQSLREDNWNQVGDIFRLVGLYHAKTQGINPNLRPSYQGGKEYLHPGDETLLMEVIWSLIIQGVLVPGFNDSNPNLPFVRLTEYGRHCVQEQRILPHDPDGYLREFREAIPGVDTTISDCVSECLQCYIRGLYRAAAVMLGAASEQAVLLLIESCAQSIGDQPRRERFLTEIERAQSIFKKFQIFQTRLAGVRANLPKEMRENLDSLLQGVFDLIRNSRNDAGHPALGGRVSRDDMYSHLRLFLPYCERIYGLIGWFATNPN